jgi:hypothetical protein
MQQHTYIIILTAAPDIVVIFAAALVAEAPGSIAPIKKRTSYC